MNLDAARLVAALDELIQAESLALRAENIDGASQAQAKAAPLIAALAQADGEGLIPQGLRPGLRSIAERRQQNQICLAELKARRLPELERLHAIRRRLKGVGPAYGVRRQIATFVVRG